MTTGLDPFSSGRQHEAECYPPLRPLAPLPAHWHSLPRAFIHQARSMGARVALADSTGTSLTYAQTLLRALVLGRVLSREWGTAEHVGLFVPPTVPAAVANLSIGLWGKIPVNLNYSAAQGVVDSSIDQCGISHVLTSAKVLDKFKITPKGRLILLEEIPGKVRLADKLWAATVARLVPWAALPLFVPGLRNESLDATATVIFTSGSTGDPKGVVLSHRNVLSNVHQVNEHVHLKPEEVVLGILPFFHAFGFTVTIWTVLCLGKKVVYHFNPLESKMIGKLCEEHRVTLLIGTPTFMRFYLKNCEPRQFQWITHLILGAEKLKPELARDIEEALHIEPIEGYGCTELSPVVAVNVPEDVEMPGGRTIHGNRLGTVGQPVPGTAIKTVDPDTGADLPPGANGMIAVKGPQVMVGYLNQPELTANVLKGGWYLTGDLGYVDADGFLKITDRLSRFSKVAGEMVPHQAVESAIMEAAGVDEHQLAVTGVPDPKHGERLCVLFTDLGISPAEIQKRLADGSVPKVWIPSPRDFIQVPEIPITSTGKVNLRRVKEIALDRCSGAGVPIGSSNANG
jgi:acyl-[acyl-carrier-protein]-phospholipid O-acyltransferase / long-chain-fatty-acid--[acyl-carrier-protein] ligase